MRNFSFAGVFLACFAAQAHAGVSVWTHHNDNGRTGTNLSETQLTPANVNATQFGKLWDYEVDTQIYAQPLVVQNVTIPAKGTHNVVFVATMNNSVYAFDADNNSGANVAPLWMTNFNNPAAGITGVPLSLIGFSNVDPLVPVGIMSTPVIDTRANTMYAVARTFENGAYVHRLHALDITTGNERSGSPVTITAAVAGTGIDAVGGVVTFNPRQQSQRSALSLANGQVTIAWGSQSDVDPYHGWVMKYDAATLRQLAVFNTTPNGTEGGIWQSGDGPAIDAAGNLYYSVGNGSWDGISNFSQSVLKFAPNGLVLNDRFTPDYWSSLNGNDLDLGVSGPVLIPNTTLALTGSKTGDVYLLNTPNLGNLVAGNLQIPQTFKAVAGHIHGQPVYYNNPSVGPLFYMWSESDYLKAFHFNGSTLDKTPVSKSAFAAPIGMPGGTASVSANASLPGTGIVWVNIPLNADAETHTVSGVLRAFDASNLTTELWDSRQNATRDDSGLYAKYVPPTVANGKVYLATFSNKLRVYGLLASQAPAPRGTLSGSKVSSATAVNLTTLGTSDWAHWPGYNHKAGGNSQISDFVELYPLSPVTLPASYSNDSRTFSWTDGTSTASGKDTNGVYVNGMNGGFQFTAPADTSVRTLTVYVGGMATSGHLRAYLSDGSAEDYVDVQPSATSYYLTYTLTYNAGSSGQLLYVQWIQTSFFATASLAGATLSGGSSTASPPPTAPTGVTASQGSSTSSVTVNWTAVSNATSYTVYRSTAQGTQGGAVGTATGSSYADTSAVAGTVYWYSVVATGTGGSSPASAQVSGYVASTGAGGGILSGTSTAGATAVNLTAVGTRDWVHWPELTVKNGVSAQISTYSVVGTSTNVFTYGDDPRTLTWTDGTIVASGGSTSGVYIAGIGNGFRITVPADTNARQLNVYVGGWNSTGKLTAHLSDGSAADFVDASHSSATGQYDGNYALTYRAGSAGQVLTVTWQQSAGSGNVTLDGAALSTGTIVTPPSPPTAPTGVAASQGTSTSSVTVGWTAVGNATSYTVYRSTAKGTQGSAVGTAPGSSYVDTTAVAGTVYWYSVVATGTGGSSPASAQVSGYVASISAGTLSGASTASATAVNLTAVGTRDWVHWPELTVKNGVSAQISTYSVVGTSANVFTYGDDPRNLTWTDGTPVASGGSPSGVYIAGIGNGFRITVPADTTARQLNVYVGGYFSTGKLTAHLSDGSAADYVDASYSSATGQYDGNYALTYRAGSAGQVLTVTWQQSAGSGNVTLDGAALQ